MVLPALIVSSLGVRAQTASPGSPERNGAIVVSQSDPERPFRLGRLRAFNPDGSVAWTRDGVVGEGGYVWSPDGEWIAYWLYSEDATSLWKRRSDGTEAQSIATPGGDYVSRVSWSPDSRYLVYAMSTGSLPYSSHIEVAAADGSGVRQLTAEHEFDHGPAWSPDGKTIAFVRCEAGGIPFTGYVSCKDGDIYSMNVDGTGIEPLTATHRSEAGVRWSPDGRRLVYTCDGTEYKDDRGGICLLNIETLISRSLYSSINRGFNPIWSPNGRRIAFEVFPRTEEDQDSEVYTIKRDGTGLRRLTHNHVKDQPTQWLPL